MHSLVHKGQIFGFISPHFLNSQFFLFTFCLPFYFFKGVRLNAVDKQKSKDSYRNNARPKNNGDWLKKSGGQQGNNGVWVAQNGVYLLTKLYYYLNS